MVALGRRACVVRVCVRSRGVVGVKIGTATLGVWIDPSKTESHEQSKGPWGERKKTQCDYGVSSTWPLTRVVGGSENKEESKRAND